MSTVFRDCLGREIKVGDVIADGHRLRDIGGVSLGIVRGFKEAKDSFSEARMQVEVAQRGRWFGAGDSKSWWSTEDGETWRWISTYRTHGGRCFITGLTEDQLRDLVAKASEQAKKP
jgi:hypothetical protein